MLKNLDIHDFRGFHHFRIPRLGRVNLLVGTNNCGKTSILEAVDILTAPRDFSPIWRALHRRGEVLRGDLGSPHLVEPNRDEVDVRRLFHGHTPGPGSRFTLTADSDRGKSSMIATMEKPEADPSTLDGGSGPPIDPSPRSLRLSLV